MNARHFFYLFYHLNRKKKTRSLFLKRKNFTRPLLLKGTSSLDLRLIAPTQRERADWKDDAGEREGKETASLKGFGDRKKLVSSRAIHCFFLPRALGLSRRIESISPLHRSTEARLHTTMG